MGNICGHDNLEPKQDIQRERMIAVLTAEIGTLETRVDELNERIETKQAKKEKKETR